MLLRRRASAALLLLGLAAPPAAVAQPAADSATLARAVADRFGEGIRGMDAARGRHYYLGKPASDFDRRVTLLLQAEHGLRLLDERADTANWIATRGAEFHGDTAAVLMEFGDRRRPQTPIHTGIDTWRFFFLRTATGWRFLRQAHVSTMDISDDRG